MCIRDRPRWALISSKRARVRLLSCSRWRNFNSVVASGTDWRDRSMPTKSRSAWLSYSASSSASSARPYHCCRQYMRSMVGTPIGWRPTRPLVGYSGSMTAISRAHGTMRSISPRNFSRRVRFFFIAYSALAKLRCDIGVLSLDSVLLRMHAPCRVRRIDQQFPNQLPLVEVERGCAACHADAQALDDALLHLIVNARDAMPDGGCLGLSAHEGGWLTDDSPAVALSVSDSSVGMTADVAERAALPFFTTKMNAPWAGMGLSAVHGFVRQSGGTMAVRSSPNAGTTVTLNLPRHRADAQTG